MGLCSKINEGLAAVMAASMESSKEHNRKFREQCTEEQVFKRKKRELDLRNALYCPHCLSINVDVMGGRPKSYSIGKALGGAMLAGDVGLLAGFAGTNGGYECRCKDCGRRFKINK